MVAYEFMRFTANHLDNRFIRILALPGMAMQRLTTVEPTEDILEVAIAAFREMYKLEQPNEELH
jgi:uncharacterized protein YqhQ